jgi:phage terminase large subunit
MVSLPHNWAPRAYQAEAWKYLEQGGKRANLVWHRRAGKDDLTLHWTAVAAMTRPGVYWHMLPQAEQGRKAIWRAVDAHQGRRRIDLAFPPEIRKQTRDTEMNIEFVNGSVWQLVGSDNYNALVGSPPVGIVFSEWALADPQAWSFLSPILEENDGWAIFVTTPRGPNHAKKLFDYARTSQDWFAQKLTADSTSVFSREQLDRIRDDLKGLHGANDGEALFNQEYFCSFEATVIGSYYGAIIEQLERDGHVTEVPYDPKVPVTTAWDLGIGDSTAIWFLQEVGREIHCIDYYEASGMDLGHYVRELIKRDYVYEKHILPHDAEARELGTGVSRVEILENLGLRSGRLGGIHIAPRLRIEDGIQAVRTLLPKCWFDVDKCSKAVEALKLYRSDYDSKHGVMRPRPVHDWTSHCADAFRTAAIAADFVGASSRLPGWDRPMVVPRGWVTVV